MIKKSELYSMFLEEFFSIQGTQQNQSRIHSLGSEHREVLNLAQQCGSESTIEIIIRVLERLNLIENDCDIDAHYRTVAICKAMNVDYNELMQDAHKELLKDYGYKLD